MNFKKLFARPVTKKAIYKKLCQFIDNNYVPCSPETEETAKPKVYKPTQEQTPISAAKPIPQTPTSPAKEQTKPVVNAQELSSSEERQTPIVRYSPRRTTSESTSEPAKKYLSDNNTRFSLSTDDDDFGSSFRLKPNKDDGVKFSRETRYGAASTEVQQRVRGILAQLTAAAEGRDTFTACMLRYMSRKGLSDATVYNRVFMDRRLFNKIRNNPDYQPNKRTALLIALALRLTYGETQNLLETAGYTLSRSNKRDVIIEFYIREGKYDIFEINEMLDHFGQPLLMNCD